MADLKRGVLLRMVGGFGDVLLDGKEEIRCLIRGKFKDKENELLVGDEVYVKKLSSNEGIIEDVLPRRNRIWRPPVANVTQMVSVVSVKKPSADWLLLNRQLVQAERCNITPIICVNKIDLINAYEKDKLEKELQLLPYHYFFTSALTKEGISVLNNTLREQTSVLAGPSGTGKTALLNAIQPEWQLETGQVSDKIERGKHTTRLVELFVLDTGGLVIDTPGFSKLNALFTTDNINYEDLCLNDFFPEIKSISVQCKFSSCFHENEPKCAVREAALQGTISYCRYQHYLQILDEIRREQWKRMR